MGVLIYWPLSVMCLCVCVCVCVCVYMYVVSNQSSSKKTHYVSDLKKFEALLHKIIHQGSSGTKVSRIDMYRVITSLSKINNTSNVAQSPSQPKK